MHQMLLGLMLRSGNDAAVAIAEHVSGSVEAFANLMNARAKASWARPRTSPIRTAWIRAETARRRWGWRRSHAKR